MAHYKYERLSAQDNAFLQWEKPTLPMHAGAVQIFASGPLATPEGGVDYATIKRGLEGILHKIPRYRQRLIWIPGTDRAVWIDDAHFSLDYHVRHTSLPRPGTDAQLKQLAARVLERPLDRERPLWEMWIVEGLGGGRFATISKTHHCMVDGASGVDLMQNLFSLDPHHETTEPRRFVPRSRPSDAELVRDDRWRRVTSPLRALGELRSFVEGSGDLLGEVTERLGALGQMALFKVVPSSDTPLNGPVGPHRSLDWMELPLADLKAIRHALDCSVNDVVLAIVTGAVREFMESRQVRPDSLEFRAATPVNVRTDRDRHRAGNRVSSWIVTLPVGERDPGARVAEIHATTQKLKDSHQATAVELLEKLHEWIPIDLQSMSAGTQNMFVTNVPGPQVPLYMMGAELLDLYVQAPLIENLGLVLGVISYNGKVCWGFNADYDRIPDLADFVGMVKRSFEELSLVAGIRKEREEEGQGSSEDSDEARAPLSALKG